MRLSSIVRVLAASERISMRVADPTMCRFAGISSFDKASSSCGRRLFARSASSPLTLARSAFCADTGKTCAGGIASSCALVRTCRAISDSISAADRSSSHSPSILFRMTSRPSRVAGLSPTRWFCHTSMSVLVTPASAARMNSTACALGRRLSVSSGSVPIAFRPGVSRITKPCCKSGCGKLITAWRQQGMSTAASSAADMGDSTSSSL